MISPFSGSARSFLFARTLCRFFPIATVCCVLAVVPLSLCGVATGQSLSSASARAIVPATPSSGSQITGQLQDESGAIVPGAHIQLRRADGSVLAVTQSDAGGKFTVAQPAPGDYRLSITLKGFDPLVRQLRVSQTALAPLAFTLKVASLAQSVTVSANDAVELTAPDANQNTPSISANDMKTLPLLDNDVVTTLESLLNTGAAGESGATLVVDGVEMKQLGVSPSAIERVSINQDPFSAQYRQPGRGQVEIITKNTADKYHGGATWTFRNSSLAATNYFAKVKAPEMRSFYEGFLTGPIRPLKDTTFLYSMQRQQQNSYPQVNATTPTGLVNESVQAPYRNTQLTMKVAHQINDHHSIFGLYRFFDSNRVNSNVGGQTLPEAGYTARYFDMDVTFHDDLILSPTKLNQFNILFERNIDRTTSATNAPAIVVAGAFRGGGAQHDTLQTENNPNISDIVSWTTHKIHQLKFGVQLPNLGRRVLEDYTNRQGTYTFGTIPGCTPTGSSDTHCSPLAAYAAGTPTSFSIQQGQAKFITHFDQPSAFFLDQIQVTPRLTVTPGVRYDFQNALPGTMDAVLPRLSIAYVIDPKHGLVLRTGGGTYMRRVGVNIGQQLARYQYAAERSLLITQNVCYVPNPTIYCGTLGSQPPNIFTFAPGIKSPMLGYYGLSLERQLTKTATVTVEYEGFRGWHALRSIDVNAPLPPFTSAARPNPNFGQVLEQDSGGYQKNDSMTITYRGRLSSAFSGYMQYEYQHSDANTEWSTFMPENQYDPNAEWSRSSYDQRHRLNLFGTFYPDKPLTLGVGFYEYSPTPYTVTTGTDDFHTGVLNARPEGVARNTENGDDYQDLQVRLGYTWKLRPPMKDASPTLQLSLSSFNTMNRPNLNGYDGVVGTPDFLQPTSASNPRRLQIGAAYNF
jgi:hypothetical protein